ncbi:MAG TPA: carbon-nitrogen hydrolase family protein [Planctomycetota bacterium]|nr:carbon-nitrogen hydrolase family protein [Planctomycetota bacterium]
MARPVTLGMINCSMKVMPMEQRRRELLSYIDEAGRGGCQIVMLPEFADHHRTPESLNNYRSKPRDEYRKIVGVTLESPFMKECSALAKKHKMVVIPNVMLLREKVTNTCVVYGPDGSVLGEYSKIHIAPGECEFFEAGKSIQPVETPFGKLGMLICYDINFPELTRCHELQGADILLWTTMRQGELEEGHFRARLAGRCIDHGLPFAVSTYVSEDQLQNRACMSSTIFNQFGQVVGGGKFDAGVVRGTIDHDNRPLERLTWDTPDWLDSPSYLRRQRRPDLYGAITRPLTADEKDTTKERVVIPRHKPHADPYLKKE